MYCPNCATQNSDSGRFCRACGRDLEVVALALDGKLISKEDVVRTAHQEGVLERLELRHAKGMRSLVMGSVLTIVSLLILFVPMLLSATHAFPWVVIWSCFFGWMAVWGAISVALGVGQVMDSNRMIRERLPSISAARADTTSELLLPDDKGNALTDAPESCDVSGPASVTETTTRHLDSSSS